MKVGALNQTTDHTHTHTPAHTNTHISVSARYCAPTLKSVEEVENKYYGESAAVFYVLKGCLFYSLHVLQLDSINKSWSKLPKDVG